MTSDAWCLYDTGVRSGCENKALDLQLLAACRSGAEQGSLRWLRFLPTVSLGRYEDVTRAVRLDYCTANDIEVARRLTGGGTLYLDPQQFCFSLIFSLRPDWAGLTLAEITQRLGQEVSSALRSLGVETRYVLPNDLEVAGRKLGSVFVLRDGNCVLFQGTLLLDINIKTLLSALRLPTEKLSPQGMRTARERLTTIQECAAGIGEAAIADALCSHFSVMLDAHFVSGDLSLESPLLKNEADIPPLQEAWTALVKTTGGVLHVEVLAEAGRIASVRFTGSLHVHPDSVLRNLAVHLAGVDLEQAEEQALAWLMTVPHDFIGFTAADVAYVLRRALSRQHEQELVGLDAEQANALMVHSPMRNDPVETILAQAGAVLVPYCAKPVWCKWRHRDGCSECGLCEVGDAYRLARERGLRVVTVTNYEHLRETLAELRAEGVGSYVGMCCGNFYLKRQQAFTEAGLPAVLMDISGSNCYELRQEDQAYAGKFEAQARLRLDVVQKVMRHVPGRDPDEAKDG